MAKPVNPIPGTSPQYAFSVKDIVEFCCREGDYHFSDRAPPTAKQGQLVHRKLQQHHKDENTLYQAEVAVEHSIDVADTQHPFSLRIRGRIDSLWLESTTIVLEEIKSTFHSDVDLPIAQHHLHLAQAKLYGYLYWHNSPALQQQYMTIRISYCSLPTETVFKRDYQFDFQELETFYTDTINVFLNWLTQVHQHKQFRQQQLTGLTFPFQNYRQGQKSLAGACYHTAKKQQLTFVHAATGIGKSVSTIFGTLKAMAEGGCDQVWYLTAKSSGQAAALKALEQLADNTPEKHPLKALVLYNQDKLCFCDKRFVDNSEDDAPCKWESGYYDRRLAALHALFQHAIVDYGMIQQVATDHQVCPHHLSQDLIPWIDIVVADFNYLFSFTVRNQAYFEQRGKHIALLVDETHNLPNRCRELYSASLNQTTLNQLRTLFSNNQPHTDRALRRLIKLIQRLPEFSCEYPKPLFEQINSVKASLEQEAQQQDLLFSPPEVLELKAGLNQWLRLDKFCEPGLGEQQGKAFTLIKRGKSVELICNNPAPVIDDLLRPLASAVFFSGSLLPLRYFKQQLTEHPNQCQQLVIESPFAKENLQILLGNLDTGYNARETNLTEVIHHIFALYEQNPGLYLICSPSYSYLNLLEAQVAQLNKNIAMLFQPSANDTQQAEDFKTRLAQCDQGLAFVIMGGSFAEGVEWPAGVLKGVVIIGSGMPSPTQEQKRLQRYFDCADVGDGMVKQGFEFAFLYPGINRVIQTAGRIQRSDADAGLVLLLDKRFRSQRYQQLLPGHWRYQRLDTWRELKTICHKFWQSIPD